MSSGLLSGCNASPGSVLGRPRNSAITRAPLRPCLARFSRARSAPTSPDGALLEAGELLVEPALELRIERGAAVRGGVSRALALLASGPAPREEAEDDRGGERAADRKQPREEVEPLGGRGGQDAF